MAIYLDANALWSWRTFTEGDRLAVSIVARQLGQEVLIPWIAAREAEEEYRRSLQDAINDLNQAHSTLERRLDSSFELILKPRPNIDGRVKTWRRRLEDLAIVLPMQDGDARTALEREITGTAPATPRDPRKPGRGGRDAAIWLSIARHHTSTGEEGHLVSADKAFANGDGGLNDNLRSDLGNGTRGMCVYPNLATFLEQLGITATGRVVALDELRDLAIPALKDALTESVEVPVAVWNDITPDMRYSTTVADASPVRILEQRRYEQEAEAVIVINARWNLTVDCHFQERDTDTPHKWGYVGGVKVEGDVQLFLEERGGGLLPAAIIGTRITSDTQIVRWADGDITVFDRSDYDDAT